MSRVGRNDQCPCGSGRKAKKCHESVVGQEPGRYLVEVAAKAWHDDQLSFLEKCVSYQAPMADEERWAWQDTGCPFACCTYTDNDETGCQAENCGV